MYGIGFDIKIILTKDKDRRESLNRHLFNARLISLAIHTPLKNEENALGKVYSKLKTQLTGLLSPVSISSLVKRSKQLSKSTGHLTSTSSS